MRYCGHSIFSLHCSEAILCTLQNYLPYQIIQSLRIFQKSKFENAIRNILMQHTSFDCEHKTSKTNMHKPPETCTKDPNAHPCDLFAALFTNRKYKNWLENPFTGCSSLSHHISFICSKKFAKFIKRMCMTSVSSKCMYSRPTPSTSEKPIIQSQYFKE